MVFAGSRNTLSGTGRAGRAEVCALKLQDLDAERGVVTVRQGKGKKDRTVPIGERAIAWVEKYLREVRPAYVSDPDEGTIFLSTHQESFGPGRLTKLVHDYIEEAGIGKTGSCHLFRHTMATLMLENGAELRFVQHMLGHAHVTTTEIYTHVAIRKLKEVHAETHPGAKLARAAGVVAAEDRAVARAELLAALDDEVTQDGRT